MANFAATSFSFSLGLDLDEDTFPDPGGSHPIPAADAVERGKEKQIVVEEDVDVGFGPSPDLHVPVLKRLRRGLRDQGVATPSTSGSLGFNCFDDDIEEFSSQEDSSIRDVPSSKQNHSVFSSKLSLDGHRILTTQSAGKLKPLNSAPSSSAALTIDPEINNKKMMLPKLTISPLQKIQFMESATDHPSPCKKMKKDNKDNISRKDNGENDSYQKERLHNHTESTTQGQTRETNILPVGSFTESFREDFCSRKSVKFSTLPSNSTPSSNAVLTINPEINSNKKMLPKLTISPLRRFQLLDSDTDDPSPCNKRKEDNEEINSTPSSNAALEINLETNSNKKMLPKLTISPLRRIQFLDSDIDEPSPCKERKEDNKGNEDSKDTKDNTESKCYQKERWHIHTETATQVQMTKTEVLSHKNPTESLWKDSCSKKIVNFATPALDEFCKEYFSSLEGSSAGQSKEDTMSISNLTIQKGNCPVMFPYQRNSSVQEADCYIEGHDYHPKYGILNNEQSKEDTMSISNLTIQKGNCPVMFPYQSNASVQEPDYHIEGHDYHPKDGILNNAEHQWSLPDPQPPAYQYFFHDDARIRKLVRERFVNFVPLGTQTRGANQHCEAEFVDYMFQFGSRGAFIQASGAGDSAPTKSSRKKKKNQVNSIAEGTILPSGDWVNPRSCMSHPKSTGTKRGHGGGQSCGRWYTQDGRKVYVSKSGQELSGRVAYQHYYKESGRKSKRKLGRAPRKGKAKR